MVINIFHEILYFKKALDFSYPEIALYFDSLKNKKFKGSNHFISLHNSKDILSFFQKCQA